MDIERILKEMTLEDKIALCSGASFWETKRFERYGIPALFMCDGPHGLRKQEDAADMLGVNNSRPATCFPAEVTTAGSWDPALLEQIGAAIGEEAREQDVGLVLGPGANLKRNPLCGRNFEYFSEDPYLAGKLAAGFIRGLEAQGVGTSLKHFAANSQELDRFTSDSILDGRTLRELYLTAFEIAVREGSPAAVMCAYPKLNGVHCSDSKELLTDILRTEWGFDGMVVTDWGAMNDRIAGFRAGCDLNMPGGSAYMEKEVLAAVRGGSLPECCVDDSARRVLQLVFRAAETQRTPASCNYEAHHALAKRAAAEGAVLLKNENGILPLESDTKIAVIGAMAENLRYQGAGSSHINPLRLSQPLEFLPGAIYAPGCDAQGDTTEALLAEAPAADRQNEVDEAVKALRKAIDALQKRQEEPKPTPAPVQPGKGTGTDGKNDNPFRDVSKNDWYHDAVAYVYENGLMSGTSRTEFSPNAATTRGMIVTILWRQAGKPVVNYAMRFEDVASGSYYEEAVRWAASIGIVNGYSETAFGPADPITREQLAAILYRYAKYQDKDVTASASLDSFSDAASVSGYALDAMRWGCGMKLINGANGKLDPTGLATRAQVAAILQRYCENVE